MREQGPAVTVRFENTGCALVDLAADPDCGESRLRVSVETWGRQDALSAGGVHVFPRCSWSVLCRHCTCLRSCRQNDSGTVSHSASKPSDVGKERMLTSTRDFICRIQGLKDSWAAEERLFQAKSRSRTVRRDV
jgi:hypothetical protein